MSLLFKIMQTPKILKNWCFFLAKSLEMGAYLQKIP